jgi:hypothetical protein
MIVIDDCTIVMPQIGVTIEPSFMIVLCIFREIQKERERERGKEGKRGRQRERERERVNYDHNMYIVQVYDCKL